jgi:hypothetical protein
MMTDFQEGDLVEATKGERVSRGRLVNTEVRTNTRWLALPAHHDGGENSTYIKWLKDHGWTLTLISRPRPELPTAPYTAILATIKGQCHQRILFLYGAVWIDGVGDPVSPDGITDFQVKTEPVKVAEKKAMPIFPGRVWDK